jgi:hypothetical protein
MSWPRRAFRWTLTFMTSTRLTSVLLLALVSAAACHGAGTEPAEPSNPAASAAPEPATSVAAPDSPGAAPPAAGSASEAQPSPADSAAPSAAAAPAEATATPTAASAPPAEKGASKGAKAAPEAHAAPTGAAAAYSGPDPCETRDFHYPALANACREGGRKAAKGVMAGVVKKAKAAGEDLKCTSCHEDMKSFHVKPNAVADLKKWL